MKLYTRTGDDGQTSLFGGGRVSKAHARVAAYGTVDELNATLGWAITQLAEAEVGQRIETLQHDLFVVGSHLATPPPAERRGTPKTPALPLERVTEMESWIDAAERELPPLKAFVLPGGTRGAAALHVARTVCRRAERAVVALGTSDPGDEDEVVRYLNRLSDLLFAYARLENHRAGSGDVEWRKT